MKLTPYTPDPRLLHRDESAISLTEVYRLGSETVRVRVRSDFYVPQSYAVAEVLTPARTWTQLATRSPETWHAKSSAILGASTLREVAADLLDAATKILGYETEGNDL